MEQPEGIMIISSHCSLPTTPTVG